MAPKKNNNQSDGKKQNPNFDQTGQAGGMSGQGGTGGKAGTSDDTFSKDLGEDMSDSKTGGTEAGMDNAKGKAGGQAAGGDLSSEKTGDDFDPAVEEITYEEIRYVDDEE